MSLLRAPATPSEYQRGARYSTPARGFVTPKATPGWPLTVLFVGYPLWWILGLDQVMAIALAVPMAVNLLHRRPVNVPRGFLTWLLFIVWVIGGVFVLQVNAPGAVPGVSNARYITWTYRLTWYLVATVMLLYVGNNREHLSSTRICRILAWMFVTVTVGGLLGTIFPLTSFPSVLELILPKSIANQSFIHSIIHPTFAQIQQVLGHAAPRPSAPFTYANTWGLNYACLLPFFVRAWMTRGSGWRRLAAPPVVTVSAIPAIYSVDRAMWIALVVMAIFLALRAALIGRPAMLFATIIAVGVATMLIAFSPLGMVVQQRLAGEGHNSNQGRTNLATLTATSVATKSPIVGFGTTRNVQGNFNSIAGGDTANCKRCSPPSMGTQGQLWLVAFTQGLVGLCLYLVFFVATFLRHVRSRAPSAGTALTVLLAGFVTMPFYGSLGIALCVIMIAVALLWREDANSWLSPVGTGTDAPIRQARDSIVRRRVASILACALIGTASGAVWQHTLGTSTKATLAVWLPSENKQVEQAQGALSVDTLGQLITSSEVLNATQSVRSPGDTDASLTVTATPNSRILHFAFISSSAQRARVAVETAARTYLAERERLLSARRNATKATLTNEIGALTHALDANHATTAALQHRSNVPTKDFETALLRKHATALTVQINTLERQLTRLVSAPIDSGLDIQAAVVTAERDYWKVSLTSGLLLGLLAGVFFAWCRERRGLALRRADNVTSLTGLAVLARVPATECDLDNLSQSSSRDEVSRAIDTIASFGHNVCVVADPSDRSARALADRLDGAAVRSGTDAGKRHRRERVIVVVTARTRLNTVTRLEQRLRVAGAHVIGVLFGVTP